MGLVTASFPATFTGVSTSKSRPVYGNIVHAIARVPTDPYFYAEIQLKGHVSGANYEIFDTATGTQVIASGTTSSTPQTLTSIPSYGNPMDCTANMRLYGYNGYSAVFEYPAAGVTVFFSMPANPFVTSGTPGSITGVAISNPTITVSADRSKEDIYDYSQYWWALSANMQESEPLTTLDGLNFSLASGWSLVLDGGNITGGMSLSGDVTVTVVTDLSGLDISGTLTLDSAGTYNFTDCAINEVENTSGGSITINALGSTTITTNLGPNITIINAKTVEVTVLDDVTGSPIESAHVYIAKTSDLSEILNDATNASGYVFTAYNYTSDTPVVGWARQHDIAGTDYESRSFSGTITTSGFSTTVRLTPSE